MLNTYAKFTKILSGTRRQQLMMIVGLYVLVSIFDMIALGSVFPFVGYLTNPDEFAKNRFVAALFTMADIDEPAIKLQVVTLLFVSITIFSSVLRLLTLHVSTRTSYKIGLEISERLFKCSIYSEYSDHISKNSSDLINSIAKKVDIVIGGMVNALNFISASILLMFAGAVLLIINYKVTIVVVAIVLSIYVFIAAQTKSKLRSNSDNIAAASVKGIKTIQEGLGAIKDIIIDSCQHVYIEQYRRSEQLVRESQASNLFISQCPKYFVESFAMIAMISGFYYFVAYQGGDLTTIIPILGVVAMGAQRLLPIVQQVFSSWAGVQGALKSLDDITSNLHSDELKIANVREINKLAFDKEIVMRDVTFIYKGGDKPTFENVSMVIKKGERLGILGSSGCGKSTLLDLIMGFQKPNNGQIAVDGLNINSEVISAWMKCVSHVPQAPYILDATLLENIAFGIKKDDVDYVKLRDVCASAQLLEYIDSLALGFDTVVGERGSFLSGGQRQRVAIARALYKNSKLIILDEATSALDVSTEGSIMKTIYNLEKEVTILIVTHNKSILSGCDRVYEIKNKNIHLLDFQ